MSWFVHGTNLSDSSSIPKKDALQTLSSCLPVYGAALGRVSARKLWNALKLEVNRMPFATYLVLKQEFRSSNQWIQKQSKRHLKPLRSLLKPYTPTRRQPSNQTKTSKDLPETLVPNASIFSRSQKRPKHELQPKSCVPSCQQHVCLVSRQMKKPNRS